MDISPLIDSLNEAQRNAVTASIKNILVLAGAGSGKTRVLVHRIAWLIQVENLSPYSIMAVTFTNKAAKEMRGRIEELLGFYPQGMWTGTFHGLAHRMLKSHWKEADLYEQFQIMDSDDQHRLIKRLLKEQGLDDKESRRFQWYINHQKDEGLRARHIDAGFDESERKLLLIYHEYEAACERSGLVDFGELLLRTLELLRDKSPDLLAHYRERFAYVLVDEFQDTNSIQYAWLQLLCTGQKKLMAVGDDDQSIYGWRGARIENIQNLRYDFSSLETIKLEQNYRSTSNILAAANAVIRNNPNRLGKELFSTLGTGEPISLYAAFNEQDEARFIVDSIHQWSQQGNALTDCTILYRSNALSRVLEEALLRQSMPYRVYGGLRFYERLEIKNALAYMRLVNQRADDTAMERIINIPTRGIGTRTIAILREQARASNLSMWQAAINCIEQATLSARATNALQHFIELINTIDKETNELSLDEQTEQIIQKSGLIEHHKKEGGEKAQSRIENLEELVTAAKQFSYQPEDGDTAPASMLTAFIDQAALDAGDSQADEHQDSVQLMTLHSAKGLEFPMVFMAGLEEGLFPHSLSIESINGLEEERRLCYVGITRAMQKLCITYAESRRLHGQEKFNAASRFISEIPEKLLAEVRLNNQVKRPVYNRKSSFFASATTDNQTNMGFMSGQRVYHDKFGEGVVLMIEGSGSKTRIQVNFETAGCKWLMANIAKLSTLPKG